MAIHAPYSRAPITEAIIDLRVEPAEDLTLDQLERCHLGEEEAYPMKAPLTLTVGQFTLAGPADPVAQAASKQFGFMFKSADEKQIFQVHHEGFTVNRLAPYQGWERLRDEARRLWQAYRQQARPRKVTRIAVRYINRFDFPGPSIDLKTYLKTSPEVSAELPQQFQNFLMQLAIDQPDIRAMLVLSETAVPPSGPTVASVALDIDLFRTDELPSDDLAIWEHFEVLRRRKNAIFEACITDKTRELIR